MYGMSPQIVRPGRTLRDILKHRTEIGLFSGDPDSYIADILQRVAEGSTSTQTFTTHAGRVIAVSEQPMPDGSWVATHQDITEQHSIEKERATHAAEEKRRAMIEGAIIAFRQSMESVLRSVNESAAAMKLTASSLFAASGQTSQRAESAVAGLERSIDQCRDRCNRGRRDDLVDRRDQPPAGADHRCGADRLPRGAGDQ